MYCRENCDHNKQIIAIDKPIFIVNTMETEGIGFEDGLKST